MPSLRFLPRTGKPRTFSIYKQVTSIGRAAGNDVTLDDPSVAPHHGQIVFDGREFAFHEVDRDAPILIHGKKKRRAVLAHGDKLVLGTVELAFSLFDETAEHEEESVDDPRAHELAGMRALAELSRKLVALPSILDQMDALLDAAIAAVHAAKGFVLLVLDDAPRIAAARNVDRESLPADVAQLSDSIVRRVLDTGAPLIVSDALNETMWRSSKSVMDLRLSSVMAAPLFAQGKILGVIYLGNDRVTSLFDRGSLDVLAIYASQASFVLQNALLLDALRSDRDRAQASLDSKRFGEIVGGCPGLVDVMKKLDRVANADVNVLVTGETGTGKELVAREVHRRSPRHKGPFVVVNAGAIPENLLESELFGHVRGAFTGAVQTRIGKFQAANGGTLFLDEIGEMPMSLQAKILRAIQEKIVTKVGDTKPERVDLRIVAATNRDLEARITEGQFREDLYYRLNVVNLHLPPLRERGEDVVVIAKHLLERYAIELGSKVKGFAPDALTAMRKYAWPGNVRQLENRLKKALVLSDGALLGPGDLDLVADKLQAIVPLQQAREDFCRRYVFEVLERNGGNRTKTAQDLGVDPRTIFRYLERDGEGGEP